MGILGGRGSWYSQLPQFGWVDTQDKPRSNALGVPDEQQGIALPSRSTLGQWFDVTAPNGQTYRLQQTDIGPAKWTGRGIDISAAAAHGMGYTPKTFPTDAGFTWAPAEGGGILAYATGSPAGLPDKSGALPPEITGGASIPRNAQPTSGAMPQNFFNAPDSTGGIFPSNAFLGYLAGALQGGNLGQSIGRGFEGYLAGQQADTKQAGQRALSGALQGGETDYGRIAQALAAAGNVEGALSAIRLAQAASQRKEDTDFREREFKFRQAEAARATKGIPEQVDERKRVAEQIGLKPDDPGYKSFVGTGKFPREDMGPLSATDKKAIMEADDAVLSAKNVIDQLEEAKKISPNANTGLAASGRATLGNILPDKLLPDAVSSKESSEATKNYENLVLGQALSQLKSIFGGNPTEGERKVLLQLQASLELPDNQRQIILKRAQELAQRRMELNQTRANELRGGTFYKTGGGSQPAGITSPSGAASPNPSADLKKKYGLE